MPMITEEARESTLVLNGWRSSREPAVIASSHLIEYALVQRDMPEAMLPTFQLLSGV